jgi:hypothetical protein
MSNVIDALKRLDRAGAESSRTSKKLIDAAITLANAVGEKCPTYVELPRNYQVVKLGTQDAGYNWYLAKMNTQNHEEGNAVFGNPSNYNGYWDYFGKANRADALQLAKDIAEGWLDEIGSFLEKRIAENSDATTVIETAKL